MAIRKNTRRFDPRYFMDEKTEEIAEAQLPDTMKAGYGDPQDDEREDAMGPRVPHEFSLTQKWEEDLAMYIRVLKDEQQSLDRHTKKGNRYARNLDGIYNMVLSRLKSMQSDLGRDLPVRRHGQGEPIDPTKYVEAPSKMEQDQIEKAVGLIQGAFSTMAQGKPVDHIQLKKDVQSAMPYGSRDYWSVKGGKSKTGGGYEYDPEMDTPTYFENLHSTVSEDVESGAPTDYKSYDELTDNQRKRVDQSVNTEIRALDMEGIEASDRAKARWRENYTKLVQDDDASTAAATALCW